MDRLVFLLALFCLVELKMSLMELLYRVGRDGAVQLAGDGDGDSLRVYELTGSSVLFMRV